MLYLLSHPGTPSYIFFNTVLHYLPSKYTDLYTWIMIFVYKHKHGKVRFSGSKRLSPIFQADQKVLYVILMIRYQFIAIIILTLIIH